MKRIYLLLGLALVLFTLPLASAADLDYLTGTAYNSSCPVQGSYSITNLNDGINGTATTEAVFSGSNVCQENGIYGILFNGDWAIDTIAFGNVYDATGAVNPFNMSVYINSTKVAEYYFDGTNRINDNFSFTPVTGNDVKLMFHDFTADKQVLVGELWVYGETPIATTNQSLEKTATFSQISTVNIPSSAWVTVVNGTFDIDNKTNIYLSYNVEVNNRLTSNMSCRGLIDGFDLESEIFRTFDNNNDQGNLVGYTLNASVDVGSHWGAVQCRKNTGTSFFEVDNTNLIFHILSNSQGDNLSFLAFSDTVLVNSSSYQLLGSVDFNTSDVTLGDKNISLIFEGSINYNYVGKSNISFFAEIDGINTSAYSRYGSASSQGSGGGLYIKTPAQANDTVTFNLYGRSSSGNGYAKVNVVIKEFITDINETDVSSASGTVINTSWSKVNTLFLNNSDHALANAVVKSVNSYVSLSGDQSLMLMIGNDDSNSTVMTRSISNNEEGVISLQNVFADVGLGAHNIYVWAMTSLGDAVVSNGSTITYLTDDVPFSSTSFEVRAFNGWDGSSISFFNVTDSTGTIFQATGGVVNVTPFAATDNLVISSNGYFSELVLNHNVLNDLNVSLLSNKMNKVYYSDYVSYSGVNYTNNLSFLVEAACNVSSSFDVLIDGVVESSFPMTCNENRVNNSGWYVHSSEGEYNISFNWSLTSDVLGEDNFTWDLTAPVLSQNFYGSGGFNNNSVLGYVYCTDSISPVINYSVYWNGALKNSSQNVNATNVTFSDTSLYGTNYLYSECVDLVGFSVDENTSKEVYSVNFALIDERIGGLFPVTNLSSVIVYVDDNSSSLDLKALGGSGNFSFSSFTDEILRFEFVYADGFVLNRYFDVSLLGAEDNRICAIRDEGLTFYEQIILSASENTVVRVEALFADCIVLNDKTRFAYQTSFAIRTFTIDTSYQLFNYDGDVFTVLASLDGGIEQFINIDTLVFAFGAVGIDLGIETLNFEKYSDTSIAIAYNNSDRDNIALSVVINRLDTGSVVYSSNTFTNINELNILFDWSTLSNVTDETLFQVVLTATKRDGSVKVLKRYFNTNGSSGNINPKVAFAIAFFFLLFGFSFTTANDALSWFGVLLCIGNLGIFAATIWTTGILWLAGINIIVLIYIIILMQYQTNKQLVT